MRRRRVAMLPPPMPPIDTRPYRPLEKEADAVFGAPEYAVWRDAVIRRAGGKCEWVEDGIPCGRNEPRMFADHIIERRDGGEPFDVANGQCLCGRHHTLKTNIEKRKRSERTEQFLQGVLNE
jgi:5-methylcytosine-specific restriction enzyme A